MSSNAGRLRSALIIALVSAMTWPARAQSASEQAELLFRKGKELMAAGKTVEACAAFDASQELDPTTPTLLNQANCRQHNGQLATAWSLFVEATRQTRAATDKASQQMYASATDRVAKLEPRLSTLRIAVPATSRIDGLEILRNGEILAPATWNQELPIDGGTYRISARAPGKIEWSSDTVVAAERDARTVEIPRLGAAKLDPTQAGAASVAPAPASGPEGASVAREPPWTAKRKLAVAAAAGGVLALATGGVLGALANRRQSDAHALCRDPQLACDGADRANELIRSGHDLAVGADVAFVVGAVAAAAAGTLWITGSHSGVAVAPAASPGQVLVTARGSF